MADKTMSFDKETRTEDCVEFFFGGDARLSVTLYHPNGRTMTKEIVIARGSFPAISWREIEEKQILGELIALQGGASQAMREHTAEIMKKSAVAEAMSKRRAGLEDAIRRLVFAMNEDMAALEADGYSEWNMPKRKGSEDA